MRYYSAILACLLLATLAEASQILSLDLPEKTIVISPKASGAWEPNDFVCIVHDQREVACGTVIKVGFTSATVKLKFQNAEIDKGDYVELSSETGHRDASDQTLEAPPIPKNVTLVKSYSQHFFAGLEAGPAFVFPVASYQFALDRRVCLGLVGGLWENSPTGLSVTGPGGFVTLSYFREKCFSGLWIQISGGGYFLSVNDGKSRANATSMALGTAGGFTSRLSQRFTLTVAVALTYLSQPDTGPVQYSFTQLIPYFLLGVGFQF